uniref:Uncharacterized protein n=1 Tax=Neobodo designis TaxID=312471 RepID=A0A7S1MI92_NEODS|mmetsp:Transcript_41081/g.126834  ORF Transcript_41081/g.126834 Transcript_41081/m.126834 type:complete len:273 (+) Transcript_41081:447-1265(+)
MHHAARGARAAVHSFIGDSVEVSWNAAASVASAKSKAVRFLLRVRTAVEALRLQYARDASGSSAAPNADPPVRIGIGGGAVGCRARVQMAGGEQQALLLSTDDRTERALHFLSAYGMHYGAMLVEAPLAAEAPDVTTVPVATIAPAGAAPLDDTADAVLVAVHQIIGEIGDGVGEEPDWLYHPAHPDRPSAATIVEPAACVSDKITELFALAVRERKYAVAKRIAARVDDTDVRKLPMVQRLIAAVEKAGADPGPEASVARLIALDTSAPFC